MGGGAVRRIQNPRVQLRAQGQAKEEARVDKGVCRAPASECGCLVQGPGTSLANILPARAAAAPALGGAYSDVAVPVPGGPGPCPGRSWGPGVGPGRRGHACGPWVGCCGPPWVLCVVLCCSVRWPFFIFFGLALPFCGAVWLVRPPALGPSFRAPCCRGIAPVFLRVKS